MAEKKIVSTLYMESKVVFKNHEIYAVKDPDGYLFSRGKYRTKILPEDLPEWFVYGYIYKRHGYMSAKGVKQLVYKPNYFVKNHLHKYDSLYISYDKEIVPKTDEYGFEDYDNYKYALGGPIIIEFVDAVGKYSDYDVSEIKEELAKKRAWYDEKNKDE